MRRYLKLGLDKLLAAAFNRSDFLKRRWAATIAAREGEIPFAGAPGPSRARLALITTGGFHAREDRPFNMSDARGDPSFRVIDLSRPAPDFAITHDYYDATDAREDRNVILPVERARELVSEGLLGGLAPLAYSFMGHLADDTHVPAMEASAREVASRLKAAGVSAALVTPA
jgi:D-proline reductase (dithiol) PrdB